MKIPWKWSFWRSTMTFEHQNDTCISTVLCKKVIKKWPFWGSKWQTPVYDVLRNIKKCQKVTFGGLKTTILDLGMTWSDIKHSAYGVPHKRVIRGVTTCNDHYTATLQKGMFLLKLIIRVIKNHQKRPFWTSEWHKVTSNIVPMVYLIRGSLEV